MANRLIIRLCELDNNQIDWLLVSATGEILETATRTSFTQLPHLVPSTRIWILVPSSNVLLTQIKLPKTNRSRLMQAIPYALEDQLAEDVDQLHFAIGDENENGTINVAVVSHQQMQSWLNTLATNNLSPELILPDVLALPYHANTWSCAVEDDTALIRTNLQSGYTTEFANLPFILKNLLDDTTELPKHIEIYNYQAELNVKLVEFASITNIGMTEPFINNAATLTATSLNLLQGRYKRKQHFNKLTKEWRVAAVLGSMWLVILIASHSIELAYFKYQQIQLDHTISALYKHVFPLDTSIHLPQQRIENELTNLNAIAEESDFLKITEKMASALHNYPSVHIHAFNYQSHQLTLSIITPDFTVLDKLTQSLVNKGLNVSRNNVRDEDRQVMAQLIIKGY